MCNTKLLLVLVVLVTTFAGEQTPRSILQILECQDRFSTLVDAIKNFQDINDALRGGKKDLTLFAPNNDAFAAIGNLPNGDELQNIVQYHLLSEVVKLNGHLNKEIFSTWLTEPVLGSAQRIKVMLKNNSYVVNDKILVLDRNMNATNGIIHTIDTVLVPPGDIFHRLAEQPTKAATFVDAISLTDLDDILKQQRLTVFVPTNQAFDGIPKEQRKALFSPVGRANLTNIMKGHIVPAVIYLGELEQSEVKLPTMADGVTLTVQKREGNFFVNGVPVAVNDMFGQNGAMNLVNSLVPQQPKDDAIERMDSWLKVFSKMVKEVWLAMHKATK
jgi:uncharacterized surface protein with fasciclin (FAS1) repeats